MKLISLILVLVALVIIFSLGILFKRNKVPFQSFVLWTLVWIVIALASVFPDAINRVSQLFGMNNRMFFVFTISIIVLFILVFINFAKLKQLELTLIKLIQQVSLIASRLEEVEDEKTEERTKEK